MVDVNKAEDKENAETVQSVDRVLDAVFKALADLQVAVKDLATSISASQEAQRGYAETLGELKGKIEKIEKAVTVGLQSAAQEAKEGDDVSAPKSPAKKKPEVSETAETVETPAEQLKEPAEHLYEKAVVAERPMSEVKKEAPSGDNELNDVIKSVLSGKFKPFEAVNKVREVIKG